MKNVSLALSLACATLLAASASAEYRISGPYSHENLAVFLIHGEGGGKQYLTLKEAVEQKKVVVSETGRVNELTIENVSAQAVFVQGGDILKGGRQDRVLSNDFVLPPHSGKTAVSAFCVEQGRWSRRGGESAAVFGSSAEMVSTKALKMAVKSAKNQSDVWKEVANAQMVLASSAIESPTSLQLTLESKAVTSGVEAYTKALSDVPARKRGAIGFAFAINGVVNSADVYASRELFAAMWPKLLKSSAVEALGQRESGATFPAASAAAGKTLLSGAERGKESSVDVDRRVKLVSRESEKNVLFESRDREAWIHRNYIQK